MKIVATFNPTNIVNIFKKYYSDIEPKAIYKLPDGYLVYAPRILNGTDFNDPYYFVDIQSSLAHLFDMRERKKFFTALENGPIWKAGK